MRKLSQVSALVLVVLLGGCLSVEERDRVHNASLTSSEAAHKFNEKTPPQDVQDYLNANAKAWQSFDEAVNGPKK